RRAEVDHSTNARCWMKTSEEWQATAEEWEKRALAAESRPLTPDAITDEMVERGARVSTPAGVRYLHPSEVREVLTAAMTESPARPEGLTRLIDTIREATYDPEPVATGEALYNAGVRVVTEEQP